MPLKMPYRAHKMARFMVLVVLLLIVVLVTAVPAASAQTPEAPDFDPNGAILRVIHAVPNGPDVLVRIDGLAFGDPLAYATNTPYFPLTAGEHALTIESADGTPVYESSFTVEAGTAQTAVILGLAEITDTADARSLNVLLFPDDVSPTTEGKARVYVIHAVPQNAANNDDSFPVDVVQVDDAGAVVDSLFENLRFGQATLEKTYDPGDYNFGIVAPAGFEVIYDTPLTLEADTLYTLIAVGYTGEPLQVIELLVVTAEPVDGYLPFSTPEPSAG
jgi:hypothetical protein